MDSQTAATAEPTETNAPVEKDIPHDSNDESVDSALLQAETENLKKIQDSIDGSRRIIKRYSDVVSSAKSELAWSTYTDSVIPRLDPTHSVIIEGNEVRVDWHRLRVMEQRMRYNHFINYLLDKMEVYVKAVESMERENEARMKQPHAMRDVRLKMRKEIQSIHQEMVAWSGDLLPYQ